MSPQVTPANAVQPLTLANGVVIQRDMPTSLPDEWFAQNCRLIMDHFIRSIGTRAAGAYMVFLAFADESGIVEDITLADMASRVGVTERTFQRALRQLVDAGLIERKRGRGGAGEGASRYLVYELRRMMQLTGANE